MAYLLNAFILLLLAIHPVAIAAHAEEDKQAAFETLYGELIFRYWRPGVRINGIETTVFDYASIARDAKTQDSLFQKTLVALEQVEPSQFENEHAAKAFWINAYNFSAMRLVVESYPVASIRSFKISFFKHPWSKKAVTIAGKTYSLQQIEKDILLQRYNDPRIIFAVSCAAVSCPDRTAKPFLAAWVDKQLDDMIQTFFTNTEKGARLDRAHRILTLSWILSKDGHLFADRPDGVLDFVLPYLGQQDQKWLKQNRVELRYFKHDWTLNDLAQAQ